MKELTYKIEPPTEGGSAIPNCGTIHVSEIQPTLESLTWDLGLDYNLNDLILGSTGKREYSGDIDLVIDKDFSEFSGLVRSKFDEESIARNGMMLHLRYPITGFEKLHDKRKPRTGFVQVDFNFGDIEWEKLYHYSDGNSSYKGAHRNLALSAVCSVANVHSSDDVDTYCRPLWQYKWKWGPKGFVRVLRESQRDLRSNVWMKRQADTIFKGPFYDAKFVSATLFPYDGTPEDLNSLESIISAVKRNYGMTDSERVWKRMAENFADWSYGKYFEYPTEIARYFPANDK